VRALAVETHENWIEAMQYLNMEPLRKQEKEALRKLVMRRDDFYRAVGQGAPKRSLPPSRHQRSSLTHSKLQNWTSTTPLGLSEGGCAGSSHQNRRNDPSLFTARSVPFPAATPSAYGRSLPTDTSTTIPLMEQHYSQRRSPLPRSKNAKPQLRLPPMTYSN